MDLIKIRSDLHKIPEIANKEFKTNEYIKNLLKDYSCKIEDVAGTGIICYFDLGYTSSIGFRADMDALQVEEVNDSNYKSTHPGYMHACGHDGHMTMLLGLIDYVENNKDCIKTNVVCVFQPAEEATNGASRVCETNFIEKYNVKNMYGIHLWPDFEYGTLFTKPHTMMSIAGELDIEFYGKAIHAANRLDGIDSIEAASYFMSRMYEIYYELRKIEDCLFSIGKFNGGKVRNVVSDYTIIEGTIRAFSNEMFETLKTKLQEIKNETSDKFGCEIVITLQKPYPLVDNDPAVVESAYSKLTNLKPLTTPFVQAEDFGEYTKRIPSMLMILGLGNVDKLHTNTFDFNPEVLSVGVNAFIKLLD